MCVCVRARANLYYMFMRSLDFTNPRCCRLPFGCCANSESVVRPIGQKCTEGAESRLDLTMGGRSYQSHVWESRMSRSSRQPRTALATLGSASAELRGIREAAAAAVPRDLVAPQSASRRMRPAIIRRAVGRWYHLLPGGEISLPPGEILFPRGGILLPAGRHLLGEAKCCLPEATVCLRETTFCFGKAKICLREAKSRPRDAKCGLREAEVRKRSSRKS